MLAGLCGANSWEMKVNISANGKVRHAARGVRFALLIMLAALLSGCGDPVVSDMVEAFKSAPDPVLAELCEAHALAPDFSLAMGSQVMRDVLGAQPTSEQLSQALERVC